MGSGASTYNSSALAGATEEELRLAAEGLEEEQKQKLLAALKAQDEGAATSAETKESEPAASTEAPASDEDKAKKEEEKAPKEEAAKEEKKEDAAPEETKEEVKEEPKEEAKEEEAKKEEAKEETTESTKADDAPAGKDFEALWPKYEEKMKGSGCSQAAIDAFKYTFGVLCSGASTMMPEAELESVAEVPELEKLDIAPDPELLKTTLVLKLNGGLGTGMGLDKAKSLLPVVQGNTFLDLIAKQVDYMKTKHEQPEMKFMLMNSFSTSKDTLEALSKYEALGTGSDLEFVQNKAPKVTMEDYTPATWEASPDNEWCPPGHGDLYAAILGSGTLDKLLESGLKYMFVSNSDNLGATLDLKVLTHFVKTGAPFMMEVAKRTEADKKGGHLATLKKTGGLTLRESAQCPKEDEKSFQDTEKYSYFNTNNLWVDLVKLKEIMDKSGGAIPLPVMLNEKTVDPRDKKSTKVIQLETAMGAAISCFEGAAALLIPRSRFAPVKKCEDLVALRSDAYVLTEDFRIELAPEREGVPPLVKLDDRYKFVDAMETLIPKGPPSLKACTKLEIKGACEFEEGVVCKGTVVFNNASDEKKVIAAGTYEDQTVDL